MRRLNSGLDKAAGLRALNDHAAQHLRETSRSSMRAHSLMPLVPSCAAAAEWRAHSVWQQAAGGLQLAAGHYPRSLHNVRFTSSLGR